MALPIVFLGPSLPHGDAARFLDADYRPPVRRGDLARVPAGGVVAIVDGVFDQNLAVSPREIQNALTRGIRVFGSSSMGALRATEVAGVVGIGRVHEMFRTGSLQDDDEVALTFDPETLRPLCEPMVNIRYAVERLVRPGTISAEIARTIVRAAKRLPYPDRTYPNILRVAGLAKRPEAKQLASMLASYDLKREDAITLLEHLPRVLADDAGPLMYPSPAKDIATDEDKEGKATKRFGTDASVLFWEFGPPVQFAEVVAFLGLTGDLARFARNAVARFALEGNDVQVDVAGGPSDEELRGRVLQKVAAEWRFGTEEEARISLVDLGIGTESFESRVDEEVAAEQLVMALARDRSAEFLDALRMELFLNDLSLKRATVRAASLAGLAARDHVSSASLSPDHLRDATLKVCQLLDAKDRHEVVRVLGWWGLSERDLDDFLERLTRARRVATEAGASSLMAARARVKGVRRLLHAREKPLGEPRFCTPQREALQITKRLCKVIGITRVAMITGLADIGIPNAQAFRPDGVWSSTVGSGKSETNSGARIGAVMEEVEKWAQEQYPRAGHTAAEVVASYHSLARMGRRTIDPRTLDLPYDTCFDPATPIGWRPCFDLIGGERLLVPSCALDGKRLPGDVFYSKRAGCKLLSTNGLASGLNLEEAVLHALCEYIERHNVILTEVLDGNPGMPGSTVPRLVDLDTVHPSTRKLVRRIAKSSRHIRAFDVRADVGVPTFLVAVVDSVAGDERLFGFTKTAALGKASHPNPTVALNMAILEAVQTVMTNVAGAREDLTLRARSLGRHERSATSTRDAFARLRAGDVPLVRFHSIDGLVSRDAREDIQWVAERVRDAGYPYVLVCDYSLPEIEPARVVRVIVPGFETTNPFRTGLRARLGLLADLLPRATPRG